MKWRCGLGLMVHGAHTEILAWFHPIYVPVHFFLVLMIYIWLCMY